MQSVWAEGSAYEFYVLLSTFLVSIGFIKSEADECLFYLYEDDKNYLYVVTLSHILCECPALSQVRLSNHIDFNRAARRLPAGPERTLAQAVVHLLHFHQPLEERGQLWTGLWTPTHRRLIQGALAGCTIRTGRRILMDISTRAAACVTHMWSLYQEALADYTTREETTQPPADAEHSMGTPPSPSPSTHSFPRLRGPFATSFAQRRR